MKTQLTTDPCRPMRVFASEERGANMLLLALVLMVLFGFAGIAIDGGNVYYQQQRMQIAADAAALGGARQLAVRADHSAVNNSIWALATANAAETVNWEYINNQRGVQVTAMRPIETYFAKLYGQSVITVSAQADAQWEPVTGVDNLFPLTMDCDCVDGDIVTPIEGGSGDNGGALPPPVDESGYGPTTGLVQLGDTSNSQYEIMFVSHVDNTWTYEVTEVRGRDLSHWLLNIDTCLNNIVSSTPSDAQVGMDASTGLAGIKWNVTDRFVSGRFSFTLNGPYPAGLVNAMAKAGTDFAVASIPGPVCDGSNIGNAEAAPTGGGLVNICLPTIGFETDAAGAALVTGQIIDTEWSAWGVNVTTKNPSAHPAMIFDTANPTGGDWDLGTPNSDFGGPGIGVGGQTGRPGVNDRALGKVLIVAERNNPADPDDNANGGTLIFTFDYPVRMDEVQILDIDHMGEAGVVLAYSDVAGKKLIATGRMLGLGDNSVQTVVLNAQGVRRLEVVFPANGSLATVVSCRNQQVSQFSIGSRIWSDLNANGIQDTGEPGIAGVALDLYVAGQPHVVARTVTNVAGEYRFDRLPPGVYEVKVVESNFAQGGPLVGALYSPTNAGAAATSSSFNSASGRATAALIVASDLNINGGFRLPAQLAVGPSSITINLADDQNSAYEITFVGRQGRTWSYEVREAAGRDLSHWSLGIANCLGEITSFSPSSGYAAGTDGSTGFVGTKWDVPGSFRQGVFSITLGGDFAKGTVKALAKAGSLHAMLDIAGPDCSVPADDQDPGDGGGGGGDIGGGGGGGESGAVCSFGWLDWNGGIASNLELAADMNDPSRSGIWRLGQTIPPGPAFSESTAVRNALSLRTGDKIKIPLTKFNGSGYAICGFAQVKLLDYNLQDGNHWLSLQFLQNLLRGVETDPTQADYGARDVRFLQ
jgi:hypothetical protein